jgi:prophage regulatory protein
MSDAIEKLIRRPELRAITSVPDSTWDSWEKRGDAPKGILLGPRVKAWRLSEVSAWIESRAINPAKEAYSPGRAKQIEKQKQQQSDAEKLAAQLSERPELMAKIAALLGE